MNHFVNNAKRSLRRMMGGSIIDIVCGLQILGVVTYLLSPELFGYLILNPALVVRGQIWRIVTFLAYPPAVTGGDAISFVIFNAIGIYCVRLFGLLVEQVWGRFKFNCYIRRTASCGCFRADLPDHRYASAAVPKLSGVLILLCVRTDVSGYAGAFYDAYSLKVQLDCRI